MHSKKGTTAVKLEGCPLFQGGYQSRGISRWLPVKWNGPSSCELLHYRNPCAPEEQHPLYGKSAPFSHRSPGIYKG